MVLLVVGAWFVACVLDSFAWGLEAVLCVSALVILVSIRSHNMPYWRWYELLVLCSDLFLMFVPGLSLVLALCFRFWWI